MALAGWAAIAIDNARLYQASEDRRVELERAISGMEASMDIALAIGGETDLDRVLELIVKRARALVEADALLIWLQEGDELRLAAHAGAGSPPTGAVVPLAGSTAGRALECGRTERLDDVRQLDVPPGDYGLPDAAARSSSPCCSAAGASACSSPSTISARRGPSAPATSGAPRLRGQRGHSGRHRPDGLRAAPARFPRRRRGRAQALGARAPRRDAPGVGRHEARAGRRPPRRARSGARDARRRGAPARARDRRAAGDRVRPAPRRARRARAGPAMRTLAHRVAERSGLDVRVSVDLAGTRLPPRSRRSPTGSRRRP